MNELTDGLLQLSYSPAINVYIVWILGAYGTYWMFALSRKSVDSLDDATRENYEKRNLIKNGEWNKLNKPTALFIIPFMGLVNDFIFIMIGGPAIVVYSKLWWGQFLPLSTIMGFFS